MSEKAFWLCTPRKLMALSKVHLEVNKTDKKEASTQRGHIDQIGL